MNLLELADRLFGYSESGPARRAAIIVGLVAVVEGLFIYLSNRRERIIFMKILSDLLWTAQYALFGTMTASLNNLIAVGRETVFYFRGRKKWADSSWWMWFFIAVMLASPAYEAITRGFSPIMLIPAVASAGAVVAFYCRNTVVTKTLMLLTSVMYLIYNALYSNVMGIAGTFGPIISTIAGLFHELAAARAAKKEPKGDSEE